MKKIIYLILVIIWMLLIFNFSNQKAYYSTKLSDSFIYKTICKVYKVFHSNVSEEKLDMIVSDYTVIVRKLAHFTIYLILGILVLLFIREFKLDFKYTFIIPILICFIYAISDETHQLFVEGRSGELRDIFIDTLGSCIGISLTLLWCKIRRIKEK